jgi:hypothetical protein
MTVGWKEKGCVVCRKLWESGSCPPEIAINYVLHSRLHRCCECGTYWEQFERYADVIDKNEAQLNYPEAFMETDE